jgi:hypothetical protein
MLQKTTLVKSGSRKISSKWKIGWYCINRGRDTRSFRWIRSFMLGVDLSKTSGFTCRIDLLKKYHVELCVNSRKNTFDK